MEDVEVNIELMLENIQDQDPLNINLNKFSLREPNNTIESVSTKVRKKTLNPHFDEEFVFRVKPGSCTIFFEVSVDYN